MGVDGIGSDPDADTDGDGNGGIVTGRVRASATTSALLKPASMACGALRACFGHATIGAPRGTSIEEASLRNDEGALVALGGAPGVVTSAVLKYYCGRPIAAHAGADGTSSEVGGGAKKLFTCGPHEGHNCPSCARLSPRMGLGSLQACPPPLASLCTPVALLPSAHLASTSVGADAAASEGETAVALGTVLYAPSSGAVGVHSCPLELADGVTAATLTAARTTAMGGASASLDSPQARSKAPVGGGSGGGSASVSSKAAGKAPVGTKAAVWSAASQHVETSPRVVADEDWLHFFGTLDVKGSGDGAILLTKPIPVLCEESALDYFVDMLALAELCPDHVLASEAASPAGEPRGRLIGAIVRVSADARLTFVGVAADASSAWTSPPELGVAGGPFKP